jgi:hypothetical protein
MTVDASQVAHIPVTLVFPPPSVDPADGTAHFGIRFPGTRVTRDYGCRATQETTR